MASEVVALYIHSSCSSRPEDEAPTAMVPVTSVEAVEGMGLRDDPRYFRKPPDAYERKRQVSLIDEGTIWRLEKKFGSIPSAFIKAQIVLAGDLFLPDLLDTKLMFDNQAELTVALARKPCFAMDLISAGLRTAMEGEQQGALARVTVGGHITVGSSVELVGEPALASPSRR